MKKELIYLILISLLLSCNSEPQQKDIVKVTIRDNFKNGNTHVDSLKELSIKEGSKGNFNRSKELCEFVAKLDSNDIDNLSRLAIFYLIDSKNENGLTLINRAIKLDTAGRYNYNYTVKACLYKELNNTDSANHYFNKMLQYNKYNAIYLNTIVSTLYLFKKESKGIEYIDLAYHYYPYDETAVLNKALILGGKDNYNEAIKLLNSIKEKTKNSNVFYNLSVCYSNTKQYKEALVEINEAIKWSKGNNPAYFTDRGRTKEELKDYRGAEQDYKIASSKGDTLALKLYNSLEEKMKKNPRRDVH